MWHW